ncbi:conserved exported hypothetical protein [Sphingomonas sp. EC-HK361]|uniref:hypothetical protein n=1 Tax=Sphingomonas sp. EC-HK361 TaxID=2038397 RepID=UPI00125A7154|nr:hypothetical protein [Sphingomonas sp. EC-HK361]VVT02138.1 conserved exported hypothetical protein [Sphingomonas sp. EC-HK361]
MPLLLALALQAAAPAAHAGERFSILAPVPNERCTRKPPPPAPGQPASDKEDIVVCADALPSQAVPFRNQIPSKKAGPSNPDMLASVALNGPDNNECGVYGENCPVAGGDYLLNVAQRAAVDLIKGAFAKKPPRDKRPRIDIPLDDPVPQPAQP